MNTMKLENKLKRKEVIPNNEVRKESEMNTDIGDNEVFNAVFSKSFSSQSKRRCYHRFMVEIVRDAVRLSAKAFCTNKPCRQLPVARLMLNLHD